MAIENHIAAGIVRAEGTLKQADVAVWLSRASYLVFQHQHGGVSDRLFATGTNPVGEGQF